MSAVISQHSQTIDLDGYRRSRGSSSPSQPQVARAAEAAAGPAPRYSLTRRGQLVIAVLLALPLLALVLSVLLNSSPATASHEQSSQQVVYTVAEGETLWGIAESIAPADDPRYVIAALKDANGITGGDVHAGQSLVIPAKYLPAAQ